MRAVRSKTPASTTRVAQEGDTTSFLGGREHILYITVITNVCETTSQNKIKTLEQMVVALNTAGGRAGLDPVDERTVQYSGMIFDNLIVRQCGACLAIRND